MTEHKTLRSLTRNATNAIQPRRVLKTTTTFMWLLIAVIALAGCDRDRSDFNHAAREDSRQAFEQYTQQHPNGAYVSQAQMKIEEKIDDEAWSGAKAKGTLESLAAYVRAHGNGRHLKEAEIEKQTLLESADFAAARASNTPESFDAFIGRWPQGHYLAQAETQRDMLAQQRVWDKARAANTVEAYQAFLDAYPKSPRQPEAVSALARLREDRDFAAATKLDTSDAWDKFIAAYGASARLEAARGALDAALAREAKTVTNATELAGLYRRCQNPVLGSQILASWDAAVYKEASASGNSAALQQYLLLFPSGQNVTAARDRIDELAWEKAQKANSAEGYKSYLALDYPKKHEAAANQFLGDAAYHDAVAKNTIESLEGIANSYNISLTQEERQELGVRLRKAYYDKALKSGLRADWHTFLNKYNVYFWNQSAVDATVSQMITNAKIEDERLLAQEIKQNATPELCEEYLNTYSKGENTPLVLTIYEPLLASAVEKSKDASKCARYTKLFPDGAHIEQVKLIYEQMAYAAASAADWYSGFQAYLDQFPDGANAQKVRDRLAFLKTNTAVFVCECPGVVTNAYGRWSWTTVFKETGGKIGYKVSGSGCIIDSNGDRWGTSGGSIYRGTLTVKPGGSASDDYWCGDNSTFSSASFLWTGEDAGGHPVNVNLNVRFK